jgi:hypothetical protein
VQQHLPHLLILNDKEIGVKFNKGVIVKSKTMNGNKIFMGCGNMKYIIQDKIMGRSGDNSITNMSNVHTRPVGCMNLIVTVVGIMHGQLVKISCDMVRSTRICIPIVVGSARGCKGDSVRLKVGVVLISIPTLFCSVANL